MNKCKFFIALAALIAVSATTPAFSKEKEILYQPYELDKLIHDIEQPTAPIITDDYIIFTADTNNRFVGIAFDFENYQTVHPFKVLTQTDINGKKKPVHMFYCYERQHRFTTIKYRLIMDGLWTTDPLNPVKEYDDNVNLYFSVVSDPNSIQKATEVTNKDTVHFIYKGQTGLQLHLAGNFTNWDPWIYQLTETSPGFYELNLPLPRGKYYYNYYIGLTPIVDNTNPNKAFSSDGRDVSVITVY